MTFDENLKLNELQKENEELLIRCSTLLTDYNYLKNSTDVLGPNEMRFKVSLDGMTDDEQHELAEQIIGLIVNHQAKYVFEVEDEGAIYKVTAEPND